MKIRNAALAAFCGLCVIIQLFINNQELRVLSEEADQEFVQQGKTLGEVSQQYQYLLEQLREIPVRRCSGNTTVFSEVDFGLELFSRSKTITVDMLHDMGFDWIDRFVSLYPKADAGFSPAERPYLKSDIRDGQITLEDTTGELARNLAYELILASRSDSELCKIELNLHFSDEAILPEGWRATHVFGRAGLSVGEFSLPYGTEFLDDLLWTSDCTNNNISILDLSGNMKGVVTGTAEEPLFNTPADIKIRDGRLYVVSENSHLLQVFDIAAPNKVDEAAVVTTNSFQSAMGAVEMIYPLGIAIGGDRIAITDGKSRIIGLDKNLKVKWVSDNGGLDNPFNWNNPYYIEYHPHLNVFVASNQSDSEMAIIDLDGKKLRAFGQGIVSSPFELAISPNGDILVSDTYENKAFIFDFDSDFATVSEFVFPESFGIPKTMTSISDTEFAVGFVGNGTAYFAVFKKGPPEESKMVRALVGFETEFDFSELAFGFNTHKAGHGTYVQNCMSCHETGRFGAPHRGNPDSWEDFPRNITLLLETLKKGDGVAGQNGGCPDCTDQELRNAITFMLPAKWQRDSMGYEPE